MGKFTISVGGKMGMTYFPNELRGEGFVGRVEGLPNALPPTLIKPSPKLADVERSLKIVLQGFQLRRKQEPAGNDQ